MVWTCDEDLVKKCMEFGVEGRRPVGRPRRTWLKCVELQPYRKMDYKPIIIITLMKKECYESEVQPYRKTDYKPMIYMVIIAGKRTSHI